MMVAWHEVPGKRAERIRPVGYGVIGVLSSIPSSRTHAIRYDVCALSCVMRFDREYSIENSASSHRTLRDGTLNWLYPGISCQATIIWSLRDKGLRIPHQIPKNHY